MLKDLLNKITNLFHPAAVEESEPAELSTEQFKKLVLDVARTKDIELGCQSTFDLLDEYADLVVSGQDADDAMPLVKHHMNMCPDCRDEFDTLIEIVKSIGV